LELTEDRGLAELGEQCGALALRCSETAGFVSQVSHSIEEDRGRIELLHRSIDQLTLLQREANMAANEIRRVSQRATGLVSESHKGITLALSEIGSLIDDVVRMGDDVADFSQSIEAVASISENLRSISRQTSILAINASIEAARAGEEASGFAAVASEVKKLAARAGDATNSVSENIRQLETRARKIVGDLHAGAGRGRDARAKASSISAALESVAALITQFDQSSTAIEQSGEDVTRHVNTVADGLNNFAQTIAHNLAQLSEARDRLDDLELSSNQMFNQVGHSGVETPDSRFVRCAVEGAEKVSRIIADALVKGALTQEQIFDTDYRVVPNTEPVQFITGLVSFADANIRPLLDRETALDSRIVGCCIVDRNGFLPTHISDRSLPQRPNDRRWNLEHSRNRQIFMDRQTRHALDTEMDWFLCTYRQDFGDGRYRALRSVFVPLTFGGRRWGLYEVGYLM